MISFSFFDTTNHAAVNIIIRISLRFDVFILSDIKVFSHSCGGSSTITIDTNGKEHTCVKQLHFYEQIFMNRIVGSKEKHICNSGKYFQITFHKDINNSYFFQESKLVLFNQHFSEWYQFLYFFLVWYVLSFHCYFNLHSHYY